MHKYVRNWLLAVLALIALTVSTYYASHSVNDYYEVRTSYKATLVQAYEYGDRCGHKGHYLCSAWKGRFKEATTGQYFNKEITGFFYQNYVDGGRKDIESYITLNREDFGEKAPWYGTLLTVLNGVFFIFSFVTMLMGISLPFAITEDKLNKAKKEYQTADWKRRDELVEEYGYSVRYR